MEEYLKLLPENVINKIFVFNSHPVADLFKKSERYQAYEVEKNMNNSCDRKLFFPGFVFYERRIKNRCGICEEVWRDCKCYCHNCGEYCSACHRQCPLDDDSDSDFPFDDGQCIECADYRELGSCPFCGRGQW